MTLNVSCEYRLPLIYKVPESGTTAFKGNIQIRQEIGKLRVAQYRERLSSARGFLKKVLVMNVSPLASIRHVTIINTDSHERPIVFHSSHNYKISRQLFETTAG